MIDLDANSTTRPLPEVVDAVRDALEASWANPSSVHRAGQEARRAVELARQRLADLIGVRARELVLCGSGTESIQMAIRGSLPTVRAAQASGTPRVLVTSDVEHAAVRDLAEQLERDEGVDVRRLPVPAGGLVDAGAVAGVLAGVLADVDPSSVVVSVQWANNETGVIQPAERIGAICRERGVRFHCDATQWVGKMAGGGREPGLAAWCDLLTFSPHKLHGPKGTGCLWVRRGVALRAVSPGAQELGRRGGTENVPGIAGAGAAARSALAFVGDPANLERGAALRDRFERAVLEACPGAVVNGAGPSGAAGAGGEPLERLWTTPNIGFPRLEGEALLVLLSERGVSASAGAACSSGSLEPSPVLLAMGVPAEVAHGSVRFSISRLTTEDEVDRAAAIVGECVRRLSRGMA